MHIFIGYAFLDIFLHTYGGNRECFQGRGLPPNLSKNQKTIEKSKIIIGIHIGTHIGPAIGARGGCIRCNI